MVTKKTNLTENILVLTVSLIKQLHQLYSKNLSNRQRNHLLTLTDETNTNNSQINSAMAYLLLPVCEFDTSSQLHKIQ